MNKIVTIIAVLVIIVLAGVLLYNAGDNQNSDSDGDSARGTVYFSVTDAAANMENVTEVTMTTDSVQLRNESGSWIDATSDQKAFNLLQLNASGNTQLWAATQVEAGMYDQVRMNIDSVTVTTAGGEETRATMPSESVTIDGTVNVNGNATTSTEFDVIADESLHTATNGSYVFAPVVEMESRSSATVSVNDRNMITVTGGNIDADVRTGVDLSGNSKADFSLDGSEQIEVDASGVIQTTVGGNSDDENSDDGTSANGSVEANVDGGGTSATGTAETNVQM